MEKIFLVRIYGDKKVRELVKRPAKVFTIGRDGFVEVSLINKDAILRDTCNREVATTVDKIDKRLDIGYALVIEGHITEVYAKNVEENT